MAKSKQKSKKEFIAIAEFTGVYWIAVSLLVGQRKWPHSRNWGYGPIGGIGLLILIILFLMGKI